MCNRQRIFIFALAAIAMPAFAGTPMFGPKKFVRTTGKPNVYNETFTVADTTQVCTLKVYNGQNGQNRISSASIALNGVEVVNESEFNQQVDSIVKPVRCRGNNKMTVTLRSAPQGFVTAGVYGISGMQLIFEKPLPAGAINKRIGYGFVEGAPGILMWLYRDDLKAVHYLDSLGNTLFMHSIEEPGEIVAFAGISKNGQFFAKAKVASLNNDSTFPENNLITVVRYDGQIMWNAENAYGYNYISNDGLRAFNWQFDFLGTSGSKVFFNGKCVKVSEKYLFSNRGDVDDNLTLYCETEIDTIYALTNNGDLRWTVSIPGWRRWPGWKGKTAFCSPDGRFIVAKANSKSQEHGTKVFLLNNDGTLIRDYPFYIVKASFSQDGNYVCLVGHQIAYIECLTGNVLWSSDAKDHECYFNNAYISNNGDYIMASEKPLRGDSSATVCVYTFNNTGAIINRKDFKNQNMKYIGDADYFMTAKRVGKYIAVNDKGNIFYVYKY